MRHGNLRHSDLIDIIRAAADGETLHEGAARLGIAPTNVSYRRKLAYERVGARNAPQAVAIAFRKGWLT